MQAIEKLLRDKGCPKINLQVVRLTRKLSPSILPLATAMIRLLGWVSVLNMILSQVLIWRSMMLWIGRVNADTLLRCYLSLGGLTCQ